MMILGNEIGRLKAYGSNAPTTAHIPMWDSATGKATYVSPDQIASGANAVDGPASATDNAIARFDGITGKIIQDSTVTVNDTTGLQTFTNIGGTIALKSGANAKCGTVTLTGATPVSVANTSITANSIIIFTLKTVGGTVSPTSPNVQTITPATGFTVAGVALDTSTYNYAVIETAA